MSVNAVYYFSTKPYFDRLSMLKAKFLVTLAGVSSLWV